jgi:hypothetical protein
LRIEEKRDHQKRRDKESPPCVARLSRIISCAAQAQQSRDSQRDHREREQTEQREQDSGQQAGARIVTITPRDDEAVGGKAPGADGANRKQHGAPGKIACRRTPLSPCAPSAPIGQIELIA